MKRAAQAVAVALVWVLVALHAGVLEYASLHPLAASHVWSEVIRLHLVGGGVAFLFAAGMLVLLGTGALRTASLWTRLLFALSGLAFIGHLFEFTPLVPWKAESFAREVHSILLFHLSRSWHGLPVLGLVLLAGTATFLTFLVLVSPHHEREAGATRRRLAVASAALLFAVFFDVVANGVTGAPVFGPRAVETMLGGTPPCPK